RDGGVGQYKMENSHNPPSERETRCRSGQMRRVTSLTANTRMKEKWAMSSSESNKLKTRHLTMMGLGSAIGAGLFLGVGVGIQIAGTSILIAYLVAGVLVTLIMYMLGEMASARPS